MTGTVVVEVHNAVGWLTISNPARRNALSTGMMRSLADALRQFDADSTVNVIVMRGEGTVAFASGADISEFEAQQNNGEIKKQADEIVTDLFATMRSLSTPLIAMICGHCIGAGMAIALGADIRICAENSNFAIPAARLGIGYPIALSHALVQVAGPGRAAELLFTGRMSSAGEALQSGIVNRVVPLDTLEATTQELAEVIAANAPLSVRAAKAAIRSAAAPHLTETAEALIAACVDSADAREGQRAFLEKRRARFQGL